MITNLYLVVQCEVMELPSSCSMCKIYSSIHLSQSTWSWCRFHDAQSDIGYSGPTHLQMPTNWSGWFYAGDSTFLSAMYFLSGVENTKASAEMCYILESPERRRKMIEDAEEQVLKDTGSSVSKSALQKDKNGSGQKGTYTANSSKGLDVEAAMMKLLQRGYTDEQVLSLTRVSLVGVFQGFHAVCTIRRICSSMNEHVCLTSHLLPRVYVCRLCAILQ